ncbi:MAG TPA: hypothetical protein VL614_00780 [Acetobacteraceae bacterium]|jgi:hypothetical protein|nr:hypothetical protein [Acetobacteraceae bacterium]
MIERIGDHARLSGTCGYRTTTDLSTGKTFRWNTTAFLPLSDDTHIQVPARSSARNVVHLHPLNTPIKVLAELNPGEHSARKVILAHGYAAQPTGGGCWAWMRATNDGSTLWICTIDNGLDGDVEKPDWYIGRHSDVDTGFVQCDDVLTLGDALALAPRLETPKRGSEVQLTVPRAAIDIDSPLPRAAIRMTAERFRQALDVLAMNSRDIAGWINADDRTVRRWASGKLDIPQDVSDWLEGLTAYLEQNPRPQLRARARVA